MTASVLQLKDHDTIPSLNETKRLKGALNPNFLNLTINREKLWL